MLYLYRHMTANPFSFKKTFGILNILFIGYGVIITVEKVVNYSTMFIFSDYLINTTMVFLILHRIWCNNHRVYYC